MANEIKRTDSLNDGRKKINNAIKAFNETVVDGDSSAEAAQARVDAKGKTHDTLKDRVDSDYDNLSSKKADKSDLNDKANKSDMKEKIDKKVLDDYINDNEFKGVMLGLKSNISIENKKYTYIPWDNTDYNISGFWNSSHPTRITIPSGVKKVKISCNTLWKSNSKGFRRIRARKNRQYTKGLFYDNLQAEGTSGFGATSGVVKVEEGDYFELEVYQSSGGKLDFRSDPYTWFSLEVVEYSNPK